MTLTKFGAPSSSAAGSSLQPWIEGKEALASSCQSKDLESLTNQIIRIATYQGASIHDAKDAAQEVLLGLFKQSTSPGSEIAHLSDRLLILTTKHRLIDAAKKWSRRTVLPGAVEDFDCDMTTLLEIYSDKPILDAELEAVFAKIPAEIKEVLVLYKDGMTQEEIASLLGMKRAEVRRLFREAKNYFDSNVDLKQELMEIIKF